MSSFGIKTYTHVTCAEMCLCVLKKVHILQFLSKMVYMRTWMKHVVFVLFCPFFLNQFWFCSNWLSSFKRKIFSYPIVITDFSILLCYFIPNYLFRSHIILNIHIRKCTFLPDKVNHWVTQSFISNSAF